MAMMGAWLMRLEIESMRARENGGGGGEGDGRLLGAVACVAAWRMAAIAQRQWRRQRGGSLRCLMEVIERCDWLVECGGTRGERVVMAMVAMVAQQVIVGVGARVGAACAGERAVQHMVGGSCVKWNGRW